MHIKHLLPLLPKPCFQNVKTGIYVSIDSRTIPLNNPPEYIPPRPNRPSGNIPHIVATLLRGYIIAINYIFVVDRKMT